MSTQRIERHVQPLALTVFLLAVGGVFLARASFARITANTINPVAVVTDEGRHVVVTGPVTCTAGERFHLRVTVTQRSTGAVAEGRTLFTCSGGPQHWEAHASAEGTSRFDEGPAVAGALGRTSAGGTTTDVDQWWVAITLQAE